MSQGDIEGGTSDSEASQQGFSNSEPGETNGELVEVPRRELDSLQERVDDLEDKVQQLQDEVDGEIDDHGLPIEAHARMPRDMRDLRANKDRAVEIWRDLPHHANLVRVRGQRFVMHPEDVKRAVVEITDNYRSKSDVNDNTVQRVRQALEELSGGIVQIHERDGQSSPSGRKQRVVVVKVKAWVLNRPEDAVRRHFPERADELSSDGGEL